MSYDLIPPAYAVDDLGGDEINPALCDPSQPGINLGDCVRLNESQTVAEVYDQPADLINVVVRNIFVVAGLIVFAIILYAGFKFIEEGEKGKEEAKTILTAALIGLIVMFSAYWIVRLLALILGQSLYLVL